MKIQAALAASLLAGFAAPALADGADTPISMKFSSIPIAEKMGSVEHKLFPYRSEDKVVVIVVDPIVCGQRPVNARFEVAGNRLLLKYDLKPQKPADAPMACAAHSTFELNNVPHRELSVEFSGNGEPPRLAHMTRCPNTEPQVDVWDCMVPLK